MPPEVSPWSGPSYGPRPRARRCAGMSRSSRPSPGLPESVADSGVRLDEVGALAQLLAVAVDMDVDGALQDHRILADGGVHQLVAGESPPRLTDQGLQQAEFGRGQGQLLAPEQ